MEYSKPKKAHPSEKIEIMIKTEENRETFDIEELKKQREAVRGVLRYLDCLIESHSTTKPKSRENSDTTSDTSEDKKEAIHSESPKEKSSETKSESPSKMEEESLSARKRAKDARDKFMMYLASRQSEWMRAAKKNFHQTPDKENDATCKFPPYFKNEGTKSSPALDKNFGQRKKMTLAEWLKNERV